MNQIKYLNYKTWPEADFIKCPVCGGGHISCKSAPNVDAIEYPQRSDIRNRVFCNKCKKSFLKLMEIADNKKKAMLV